MNCKNCGSNYFIYDKCGYCDTIVKQNKSLVDRYQYLTVNEVRSIYGLGGLLDGLGEPLMSVDSYDLLPKAKSFKDKIIQVLKSTGVIGFKKLKGWYHSKDKKWFYLSTEFNQLPPSNDVGKIFKC